MKFIYKTTIVLSLISALAGCSSSPKTNIIQVGDNNLTQQEILSELAKLDTVETKIKKNKGVNVTNVASSLFWWPGLAYTYIDANDAEYMLTQRRAHLAKIYNEKYGHLPIPQDVA